MIRPIDGEQFAERLLKILDVPADWPVSRITVDVSIEDMVRVRVEKILETSEVGEITTLMANVPWRRKSDSGAPESVGSDEPDAG